MKKRRTQWDEFDEWFEAREKKKKLCELERLKSELQHNIVDYVTLRKINELKKMMDEK